MPKISSHAGIAPRRLHAQTVVSDGVHDVAVDTAIASLLEWLWTRGCRTVYSCQGGAGEWACITFSDATSVELALREMGAAVNAAGDLELRFRMAQRGSPVHHDLAGEMVTFDYEPSVVWRIAAWPQLWFMGGDDDSSVGEGGLLRYQLEFPPSDLPRLRQALRLAGKPG